MLQESIGFAKKVLDNVDVMLGYWGRDLRCRFANDAYQIWFGRSRQEMLGLSMQELLGPLYRLNRPHIRAALNGQTQIFERDIPLPDGSIRHSLASYYPDFFDGWIRGFSVQVADVTRLKCVELELKEAKERAEWLATHDFLTGLPNRVLLTDRISNAIARAARDGGLVGVVAIDIDGFKAINDNFGHDMGDAVLNEIAVRMKRAIRSTDTITRLGGDEFVFLVSEVARRDQVIAALHRLLYVVCRPLRLQAVSMTPGLSCGISLFPSHGQNANELLARADSAPYQAKRQGKNCFVFAPDLPDTPDTPFHQGADVGSRSREL